MQDFIRKKYISYQSCESGRKLRKREHDRENERMRKRESDRGEGEGL